jgi:hypothetical protein
VNQASVYGAHGQKKKKKKTMKKKVRRGLKLAASKAACTAEAYRSQLVKWCAWPNT